MSRVTDRYCCLGCGRFWRMPEFEIKPGDNHCPYCGDMYWVDNVQPDAPPPLFTEVEVNTPCFHHQVVELFGDMQFCSVCGRELHGANLQGETLFNWQLGMLEVLGV